MKRGRGDKVYYKIEIDPACEEPHVIIKTPYMDERTQRLAEGIRGLCETVFYGYRNDEIVMLRQEDLLRIYSQQQKVFAQTAQGVYLLHMRLYEAETMLDPRIFLRISGSEIVNSKRIEKLDISITGTIGVFLAGGIKTFASRRYVTKIKQFFGLRREEVR